MKGIEFKDGKGCEFAVVENTLVIKVALDQEPETSRNGNPIFKSFVNFNHDGRRIWGSMNLNVGQSKAGLREELEAAKALIAKLEAEKAS